MRRYWWIPPYTIGRRQLVVILLVAVSVMFALISQWFFDQRVDVGHRAWYRFASPPSIAYIASGIAFAAGIFTVFIACANFVLSFGHGARWVAAAIGLVVLSAPILPLDVDLARSVTNGRSVDVVIDPMVGDPHDISVRSCCSR